MHIRANCNSLLENLSIVERAVPVRSTLPIINGILLEAEKDELTFSATNLDIGIRSSNKDADIQDQGSTVLPVKIVDILRQLPSPIVEITVDQENYRTEIKSGKARFVLYGMNSQEFPSFTPEVAWKNWTTVSLKTDDFKNIFKKVIFAVSSDESKPPFRGILMEKDKNNLLTCLSSDTYRLACLQQHVLMEELGDAFRLLVPGKSLHELLRIIDKGEEKVNGYFKDHEIIFTYRQFTFYMRLLEDRYPNLMNVFPVNYQTRVVVDKELLEQTIGRAALLAQGYNHMISLQVENNVIKVKAGSEMGRMEEELELVQKEGDDLEEILVNARYFLDPLRVITKKSVVIDFNGYLGPCIFNCGTEGDAARYRYLVLPIKVDKKEN